MPTVRAYGPQRVQRSPAPNTGNLPAPDANVFGADADRAIAGVGETAQRAGAYGLELANTAKLEADDAAYKTARNSLAAWTTDALTNPESGALNVKGQAAVGLLDRVGQQYKDQAGKIAGTLAGQRQKDAFQNAVSEQWVALERELNTHTSREVSAWQAETNASGVKIAADNAIRHYDDLSLLSNDLGQGIAFIKDGGRQQGLPPAAVEANIREFQTHVHDNVIKQYLATGQDRAAQVYFEETKDQISGEAQSRIQAALESATTEGEGLRTATDLWTKLGPKSDADPIQLDAMEEAARAKYAEEPKLLKATMSFLRERKAAVDASRKDREDATLGTLWKSVTQGATLTQMRTMPEYLNAPGKVQAQISDYIVQKAEHAANLAYTQEAHAAARESRAYTQEQRAEAQKERAGMFQYFQLLDHVHEMSDGQIWATVPTLGEGNATRLMEAKRRAVTDPHAIDDFRSDTAVINGVLEQAHIDPNPGKDEEDARANVGWYREQVAAEQNRVQGITKKKLTNDELEAIAKRIIGQQVLSGGWKSYVFGGSPKALITATIADVPSKDYEDIKASYAASGQPNPSDDQILATWRAAKLRTKK